MTVRLFTSLYPEPNHVRRAEIHECLRLNQACYVIEEICLLIEGDVIPPDAGTGLVLRQSDRRPRYRDFFEWANQLICDELDVTIVANSDIFFDSSLSALHRCLRSTECAAVSRWEFQSGRSSRLFDRNDSQDVWVFKGRIRSMSCDFPMGVPRCDNRLLHELRRAGYEVINPAFSVRSCHLHAGERSDYPENIDGLHVEGPYEYLWPHNLMSLPATVLHNIRYPDSKLGWRIDWRRLRRTLPWRVFEKVKRSVARYERRVIEG